MDQRRVGDFLAMLVRNNPGVDVVRQIVNTAPPPKVIDPKELFK